MKHSSFFVEVTPIRINSSENRSSCVKQRMTGIDWLNLFTNPESLITFFSTNHLLDRFLWTLLWLDRRVDLSVRSIESSYADQVCFWSAAKKYNSRYIKVKVEHYLLFMFSPPKISWTIWGIKYIFYSYFLFSI
jgi:hypothetical protein